MAFTNCANQFSQFPNVLFKGTPGDSTCPVAPARKLLDPPHPFQMPFPPPRHPHIPRAYSLRRAPPHAAARAVCRARRPPNCPRHALQEKSHGARMHASCTSCTPRATRSRELARQMTTLGDNVLCRRRPQSRGGASVHVCAVASFHTAARRPLLAAHHTSSPHAPAAARRRAGRGACSRMRDDGASFCTFARTCRLALSCFQQRAVYLPVQLDARCVPHCPDDVSQLGRGCSNETILDCHFPVPPCLFLFKLYAEVSIAFYPPGSTFPSSNRVKRPYITQW